MRGAHRGSNQMPGLTANDTDARSLCSSGHRCSVTLTAEVIYVGTDTVSPGSAILAPDRDLPSTTANFVNNQTWRRVKVGRGHLDDGRISGFASSSLDLGRTLTNPLSGSGTKVTGRG